MLTRVSAELSQEYFLRGEAEMEIYEQLLSQVELAGDGTAPSKQSAGGELRKQNAHNCLQAAVLHINYAIGLFKYLFGKFEICGILLQLLQYCS